MRFSSLVSDVASARVRVFLASDFAFDLRVRVAFLVDADFADADFDDVDFDDVFRVRVVFAVCSLSDSTASSAASCAVCVVFLFDPRTCVVVVVSVMVLLLVSLTCRPPVRAARLHTIVSGACVDARPASFGTAMRRVVIGSQSSFIMLILLTVYRHQEPSWGANGALAAHGAITVRQTVQPDGADVRVDASAAVDDSGRVRRCASCDRRRYDNAIARDACNRTLSASVVAASISATSVSLRRDADAFSRSGRSPAFPRARPRSVRASDRRSADASRCYRGPRAHTAPPSP